MSDGTGFVTMSDSAVAEQAEKAEEKQPTGQAVASECSACVEWGDDKYHSAGEGDKWLILFLLTIAGFAGYAACKGSSAPSGAALTVSVMFLVVSILVATRWFRRNIMGRDLWFFLDKAGHMHCHDKMPTKHEQRPSYVKKKQGNAYVRDENPNPFASGFYWGPRLHKDFHIPGAIFQASFNGRKRKGTRLGNTGDWSIVRILPRGVPCVELETFGGRAVILPIDEALKLVVKYRNFSNILDTLRNQSELVEALGNELSELKQKQEGTEHALLEARHDHILAEGLSAFLYEQTLRLILLLRKWPQDSKGAQACRGFLEMLIGITDAAPLDFPEPLDELASMPEEVGARVENVTAFLESKLTKELLSLAHISPTFAKFMSADVAPEDVFANDG